MSSLPIDVEATATDRAERISRARLRLLDAAADLRPAASPEELSQRLGEVTGELHAIECELRLLMQVARLEDSELEGELQGLDDALRTGWIPASEDVDDLVKSLKHDFDIA